MHKYRVAIKFCGCCNPYVDLSRIARHLRIVAEVSQAFELISLCQDTADVVVILCGCPRACGNRPDIRNKAGRIITIVGESLNGKAVPEAHIPAAMEQELTRILDS